MKTLKTLFVTFLLATFALASFGANYNETRFEVKNNVDLKTTIKKMISDDFVNVNNYFHQNGISNLNERVLVKFYIDENNKVQVIAVEGGSDDAKAYVKQLLGEKKIKASDVVAQKYYSLALVIDYRS
ncbi:MAG TPA: hypothetical protein PLS94_06870 [Prolixibacteraceae bacterium]|nr:hypothetical protein [Prolixibacteraceae bacterium]HPR61430.1 hypothetical protein [Prolixibacteraceae bacterium]